MDSAWLCVVLNRNLCTKGVDVARKEIERLTNDAFMDFRMVEDEYDGDCYSFVKCRLMGGYMEKLRASHYIVTVLDSYDSPTYLSDSDVRQFIEDGERSDDKYFVYGDTVIVEGEGIYSGLHGVVLDVFLKQSLVTFRFHTLTLQRWIDNEELVQIGSVFAHIKFPVTNPSFLEKREKYPIFTEADNVGAGELDRYPDREGEQK